MNTYQVIYCTAKFARNANISATKNNFYIDKNGIGSW